MKHTPSRAARGTSAARTRWFAGALAALLLAGAASAQLRPPQPSKDAEAPFIKTVLLSVLIVGGIIGASMIPSKRGHQD